MVRTSTARRSLGWFCYFASAVPFIAFVAVFLSVGASESAEIIIVNLLLFAGAGITAALVKNMAFNTAMAISALPYASFLLEKLGNDPSTWSANDTEGSVVTVSIYCLVGWGSTAVWILIRARAIWQRMQRAP